MDYRENDNRKEAFVNWFGWSLELNDCDSALYMTNYFFDRFEYNTEQRLWLIWLYGITYYWPTAYIIWNEFPDLELLDIDRLQEWNDENYTRLRYQSDTKFNKRYLIQQVESYKEWIGDRTQREALDEHITPDSVQTFENLWEVVGSWKYFGRFISWFYLQTLTQCTDIKITAPDLRFQYQKSSHSHRNGLCFALGLDHWSIPKSSNKQLSTQQIEFLDSESREILNEVKLRFPDLGDKVDYFAMETALCSFKKLFRKSRGRYLGYYLDRQAEEIKKVESDRWDGIDWQPLWQARDETLMKKYLTNEINKGKMEIFMDSGIIDYNNTFAKQEFGLGSFMV
jgi:hypothetical protein